jgi:hypothetical protein
MHARMHASEAAMGDRHPSHQVICIHAAAPPKPAWGAPCNGCGVCCLAEPCPVGMLVSRRRTGACAAVTWVEEEQRYRCGVVLAPAAHLPRWLRAMPRAGQRGLVRLALRFIAAGKGCDSDAELEPAPGAAEPPPG